MTHSNKLQFSPLTPYRVLSLDGGGMRGLYTLGLLKSLSDRFCQSRKVDIGKGFDLIVGTSTGGFIATGLAAGVEIEKMTAIYRDRGRNIFTNPMPKGKKWSLFWWVFRNLCKPANTNDALKRELEKVFKEETVEEVFTRRQVALCVTAINIVNNCPRVFKTPHNPEKHADNKRKLVDICLATSAAPIIFPIASIPDPENTNLQEGFVDGGLWANNPTLIGLIEAIEMAKSDQPIEIISMGTCSPAGGNIFNATKADKGIKDWRFGVRPLEISMDAQSMGFTFMCDFLTKKLNDFGKKITVYRLESSKLSKVQEDAIGLDIATEDACNTMQSIATLDGQHLHGKAHRESDDKKLTILKNIFENLPTL